MQYKDISFVLIMCMVYNNQLKFLTLIGPRLFYYIIVTKVHVEDIFFDVLIKVDQQVVLFNGLNHKDSAVE